MVEELFVSSHFQFMIQFLVTGGKTTFAELEKMNYFENDDVMKIFGDVRITNEYAVAFNNILKSHGLLLEGDK